MKEIDLEDILDFWEDVIKRDIDVLSRVEEMERYIEEELDERGDL